jgi:hypothetical protein
LTLALVISGITDTAMLAIVGAFEGDARMLTIAAAGAVIDLLASLVLI